MGMNDTVRINVKDVDKNTDVEDEPIDEVKDIFEGANARLDKLSKKVCPLKFPRQLWEAVMGIFLVGDEEGKRDILNELREATRDI